MAGLIPIQELLLPVVGPENSPTIPLKLSLKKMLLQDISQRITTFE